MIFRLAIVAIAVVTALPLAVAVSSLFADTGDIQAHLIEYVLPEALWNTVSLAVGVAFLSGIIGVALAWITTVYEFPGRRFFNWALLLPMAMPGYVLAFAFLAIFDYTGPVQTYWRALTDLAYPGVGSRLASIVTLSLVLYPYVYLVVRGAFASQGVRGIEVAQSVGMGRWQGFRRVSLPLARPFIVAGIALVVMESLADFGTVQLYNYTTFTTAIYRSWYGLFSLDSALQLSLVLILLVVFALAAERWLRGRAQYTTRGEPRARITLSQRGRILCSALCGFVFVIAFLLPAGVIAKWALQSFATEFDERYWQFAANSLQLAGAAAILVAAMALLLAASVRRQPDRLNRTLARVSTLGYAIPGTVLAVGFFVPVASLSRFLNDTIGSADAPTIALQSGLLVIFLAYLSRFLAVGHGPVDGALQRIRPSVEEASRGMGISGLRMMLRVHLPIIRPSLLTAVILVFVDIMKELPITLMTRPFGWDTLAVRVFQLTTEGEWQRAALPALAILLAGIIPVILLTRRQDDA